MIMQTTQTSIKASELRIGNWLLGAEGEPQRGAYVGETIGLYNLSGGTLCGSNPAR